ncbi:MAG: hypothetical protein KDA44_01325 [Planctomycetales bacterium]|nr:hypothetical protein [Planctomycetales bacterium]
MSHEPIFADDRAAIVWPAWLFSAVMHAAALTLAAVTGAAVFHGAGMPPQQPAGWDLQLALADEPGPPVEEADFMAAVATEPVDAVVADPVVEPIAVAAESPTESLEEAPDDVAEPADAPLAEAPPGEADDAAPPKSMLGLDELLAESTGAGEAAAGGRKSSRRGHFRVGQVGGRATVRVFGVEGTGSKFVYLFDRSTSMAGAPLAAAQQQLVGSLAALDTVHQFHVIFFNHRVAAWSGADGAGRIAFATDRNKQLAEQFVRSITASGGTYRLEALHQALRLAPDVIFFLTDADDTMPASEVAEAIASAGRTGTTIACIEFGTGPSTGRTNFLTEIARGAGGQYGYVDVQQLGR